MAERVYCKRCNRFLVSLTGTDSVGNYLCPACGADARLAPADDAPARQPSVSPGVASPPPVRAKLKLVPTGTPLAAVRGVQPPPVPAAAKDPPPPAPATCRPQAASRKDRKPARRRRRRGNLHRQGPSGSLAVFLIVANLGAAAVLCLRRPDAEAIRQRFGLQDPPPPPRAEADAEPKGPAAVLAALCQDPPTRRDASGRPETPPRNQTARDPAVSRPAGPAEYRIWISDGQVVTARLIEEKPTYVRIRHDMGANGFIVQTLRRSEILNMAALEPDAWSLQPADRRLVRDFPGLRLYRRSPFLVMTDDSFGSVEKTFRVLQSQHRQFLKEFEGVIDDAHGTGSLHVVFFRSDGAYRAAAGALSPHLVDASGFYDPDRNRLLLYNQINSQAYANVEKQIETVRDRYQTPSGGSAMPASLRDQVETIQRRVANAAQEATFRTIRHEAAHQLFYHFGVHAPERLDPTWLVEGLATYCETPRIGRRNPERIEALREAAELIPVRELLAYRGGEGWNLMSRELLLTAYAQSWALVHTLMQPDLRPAFLAYLRSVRDSGILDPYAATDDPVADLAAALRIEPGALETAWQTALASF